MDILERIKNLRDERGWSNYRLTEEAQLNTSTLQNMFSRKTMPSIDTLVAICNAFDITLAQFFNENENNLILSAEEIEIVETFRQLPKKTKTAVKNLLKELV